MRASVHVAALAGVLLFSTVGCGAQGASSAKTLRQEATTVASLAAEGSLLAGQAARGRSTAIFVRMHGGSLKAAASASATLLARGDTPPARRLARVAGRVAAELGLLARSGADRAAQGRLEHALARDADAAAKLGKSL